MSHRGNCLGNAPMESFLGHLKDNVDYQLEADLDEICAMVDSYVNYYNTYIKITPYNSRTLKNLRALRS